jgi:hypothetical protein
MNNIANRTDLIVPQQDFIKKYLYPKIEIAYFKCKKGPLKPSLREIISTLLTIVENDAGEFRGAPELEKRLLGIRHILHNEPSTIAEIFDKLRYTYTAGNKTYNNPQRSLFKV